MNAIRTKLLGIFQGEHQDYSGQIRLLLRRILEAENPGPDLEEAFRRAHSLKGAARAVGLDAIETVSHRLEALFARAREGALRIDQAVADVIHDALDCSEDLLANAGKGARTANPARTLAAIDALLSGRPPEADAESQVVEAVTPADAPPAPPGPTPAEDEEEPDAKPSGGPASADASMRLRASHVDRLLRTCDQLATVGPQQGAATRALDQLARDAAKALQHWERLRKERFPQPSERRPLEEMDRQLRSLLTRSRRLLVEQRRGALAMRRFSEDLRIDLWKARMTPASSVCDGFGSMVRELAASQKKVVRFHATGLETEADRDVLQALREPALHLLRNAVSHGLETPSERELAGKPAVGRITLSVEAAGGVLTLRVSDDGRGVDMGRIAEEARRRGRLEASDGGAHHERLQEILFEPGFSTASTLTEVAGRGMGLSVVHEATRRLHGSVEVHSEPGLGTQVTLRTPLSVITQRVLLVLVCGRTFALSMRTVDRVARVDPNRIETIEGRPAVQEEGRWIPLASLAATLGLPGTAPRSSTYISLVVVNDGDQATAFAVDQLIEQREALVKDLGIPEAARGVATGGVLLEGGAVAILLNAVELVKCARTPAASTPAADETANEPRRRRILLADDSITTRALEKSILEVHGYEVLAAVDGVEALNMLRAHGADLVISDVQMPRMDGFELLDQIKNDKRLRETPVIILTSLERREEQEKGLALGADAYIVKRKFDQRELLETIRQIL